MVFFGFKRVPPERKKGLVVDHFRTVARRYDRMNTLLSFGIHHLWKKTAVRMMGLRAGDRILDVCGGTADLSILAARRIGSEGHVVLCDIDRAMIEAGRGKVARSSLAHRIHYLRGDAEGLPIGNERFDGAMVGFGIRNLTHMEKGLREIHRILRPGGKMMCLEFSMPTATIFRWLYDFYSFSVMPLAGQLLAGSREAYSYLPESIRTFPGPERLKALLEGIGFQPVSYRRLTNGIAVVHRAKKP